MAKYIRVEMHLGQPKETLELCDKIIEKDTADDVNSSLTGFVDMTAFGNKVTDAKNKRKDAEKKDESALKKYQQAEIKSGLAKGQHKDAKDTILWYVRQIKSLLLNKNDGNEEALNEYGFSVVITQTGARKNVKIELPFTPEGMIELGEDIAEQHTALDVDSPLTAALVNMAAFGTLVTDAGTLLHDWGVLRGQVQSLHNQAIVIIGYGMGQTSDTAGTISHDLNKVRDRLLQKFQGEEEALSEFGFKVVLSEHSTGPKKGSAISAPVTIVRELDVNAPNTADIPLAGIDLTAIISILFETGASPGQYYAATTQAGAPGVASLSMSANASALKQIAQVGAELGFDNTHTFLTVRNTGAVPGHYKVTFTLTGK